MTVKVSVAARNAAVAAIASLINTGGAGSLKLYTGSQPLNPDTTASGTLLATFTLNNPAFSSPTSGTIDMILSPALNATAGANGTAGYVRILNGSGAAVYDGSVGPASVGTADFLLNSTSIVTGQVITILNGTLTFPSS